MLQSTPVQFFSSLVLLVLLSACGDSADLPPTVPAEPDPPEPPPELRYSADIVWTEFGIPHITAQDWGSLGYGTGYTFAQENYCTMMGQYVVARGETARYFGEQGNVQIDLVWKLLNNNELIQDMLDSVSADAQALIEGYADGFNRYLDDTGLNNLPEACRGAAWVRLIDSLDVMRVMQRLNLFASGDSLAPFIAAAPEPPAAAMASTAFASPVELIAALDPQELAKRIDLPERHAVGSNAYAIGGESTQSGSGVMLSNPHLFWDVPLRYTMLRQTMADQMDVMGATPFGVPVIGVGFNQDMAWGITVSTSNRFTLYELQLNPDNPLQYLYDGEFRELEATTFIAERMLADGSVETVERTFYQSHYGPVLDLGSVSPVLGGWPNAFDTLFVYRDANLGNARVVDQWKEMGQAANVSELKEATRAIAQPFINTMATDRFGDVFFGNISVSANVSDAQFAGCTGGPLASLLTSSGLLTLDGSDSFCEWGSDDDAPQDGLFGWDNLPKLDTRDYVANSNDSHWHVNPRQLLEGFPVSLGAERSQQSFRTRHTFDMAERRMAGTDDLGDPGFTVETVRDIMYRADNYAAELVVPAVIELCQAQEDWSQYSANPEHVTTACNVLADWDRAHRLDSVGAHIFWEMWQVLRLTPALWEVPFDTADPINTPRDLNTADSAVAEAVRTALAGAVATLDGAGVALDAVWGDIQYEEKNGVRYGIHGGDESMMFSAILAELVEGEGYSNITLGNSYIQAVTWDESNCPDASAVLTYSQSTNPESPHYADSTQLYSESGWIDMPFCAMDVEAAEISRATISE